MSNDPTTVNNSNLVVGGIGGVSLAALSLAIFGTFFHTGNLVSVQQYTTSRLLNGTQAIEVLSQTGSTATGGLKSGGALGNYNALAPANPLSATNAPLNGLTSGTGTLRYFQVELVAPQVAGRIACSIANASIRGSGGTLIFSRTVSTGATLVSGTGSFSIAPTETVRCSMGNAPSAAFNIKTLMFITPSRVSTH